MLAIALLLLVVLKYSRKSKSRFYKISDLPGALISHKTNYPPLPLNEPIWRPSSNAGHMKPDDTVVGIYKDGIAWALPWWIMTRPHVANLTLENQPIVVTFCRKCSAAAAFDPTLEGEQLNFRVIGIYNGASLMTDDKRKDYWDPQTGEALTGPNKGTFLKALPLHQSTWEEWLELHPESLVLYDTFDARKKFSSRSSLGGPILERPFADSLVRPLDTRLPHNTLVFGVESSGVSRAYPIAELDKAGAVLNDRLGKVDIVIFHKPETLLAMAFSRQIGEQTLLFKQTDSGEIMDTNTGSLWNINGEAYEGSLKGKKLSFVTSLIEEWYAWGRIAS